MNKDVVGPNWRHGRPERRGWYYAGVSLRKECIRFFNGATWSAPAYPSDPPEHLIRLANIPADTGGCPVAWLSDPIAWGDSPHFETPPTQDQALTAVAQAMHADLTAKQTNPKDAVGVRKAPMSTVSAPVLAEVGVAMLEGALKYGRHNYRGVGVRASVYYDATMRHLFSWWEGEDIDPDSCDRDEADNIIPGTGLSHVTKAITSLVVLRDAMIQGKMTDDRPPRSAEFYGDLNRRAAALVERAPSPAPRHYTIADSDEAAHEARVQGELAELRAEGDAS